MLLNRLQQGCLEPQLRTRLSAVQPPSLSRSPFPLTHPTHTPITIDFPNRYKVYKLNEICNEKGILLAKDQWVGTGDGFEVCRNLYERADGSRFSVQTTQPRFGEQKVRK
jgi:hypothetical protein